MILDDDRMPGARWFPEARLNFSENLLRRRDDADAIVFWGEDRVRRRLSHRQLYDQVARVARALHESGVRAGDRVAAILPNMPETVVAMLASASLGATWCSCSPDFGVQGVVDRFVQIKPKVLFAVDGYYYSGKTYDCLDKLRGIVAALPSLERVVVVPYTQTDPAITGLPHVALWDDFTASQRTARSSSRGFHSITRSSSCFRRVRQGHRSASCTGRAGRCCNTSRSRCCTPT